MEKMKNFVKKNPALFTEFIILKLELLIISSVKDK